MKDEIVLVKLPPTVYEEYIITSTPNAETDQFAQIWKEANSLIVDKNGVGANGFKTFSKT